MGIAFVNFILTTGGFSIELGGGAGHVNKLIDSSETPISRGCFLMVQPYHEGLVTTGRLFCRCNDIEKPSALDRGVCSLCFPVLN